MNEGSVRMIIGLCATLAGGVAGFLVGRRVCQDKDIAEMHRILQETKTLCKKMGIDVPSAKNAEGNKA